MDKYKKKKYSILIFVGLFTLWFLSFKKNCSCPAILGKKRGCYRYEVFGIQINHIYTFILLGYFYQNQFITIQTLGILWELFEYYIDKNPEMLKDIGGCLDDYPYKSPNIIRKNKQKYINPIDKFFKIKTSTIHGWHYSVVEIIINILSFYIGSYLKNRNFSNKYIYWIAILPLLVGI